MTRFLARIRVVLTSVVAWLTLAGAVLGVIASTLAEYVDVHPIIDRAVAVLLALVSVLFVAVLILRRIVALELVQVPEAERGILPPPVVPHLPPRDPGVVQSGLVWFVVGLLAIVALAIWIIERVNLV